MHLKYFDGRGAAETIRMLFAVSGIAYTDERFTPDFTTSPPSFGPEFAAAKANGDLAGNLGRVPILVVPEDEKGGGNKSFNIGQSKAIERFIANRGGLMGDSDVQAAMIDAIVEHGRDLKDKYQKAKSAKEEKEKALATFFDATMPEFMEQVEMCLVGTTPGCAVGSKISYADVSLYMLITEYFDNKEGAAASITKCPKIQASVNAIAAHPGVVAWLAKRPSTVF